TGPGQARSFWQELSNVYYQATEQAVSQRLETFVGGIATTMKADPITLSFSKNWKSYLKTVSEQSMQLAAHDIEKWLGNELVSDKTV
ncbi:hypothetical protein L9G16_21775, partial [Shewanella sp. A25]|nr:hypothetical protein [Shewanella shenzhenensis]